MNDFKTLINSSQPIVGLSPMDGYTDEAFRLVLQEISSPDVMFTEFVSAEGLCHGGVKLYETLLYSASEHPIVGQLFGKDPDSFYQSAIILCSLGFDGIDINMGCPAKTVIQNGSGGALIDKPELASLIINAVKKGVEDWSTKKVTLENLKLNQKTRDVILRNQKYSNLSLPFLKGRCPAGTEGFRPTISVKTRLGVNESTVDTWIPHLLSHQLDFITIHGRNLKQGYAGTADWLEIVKAVKIAKGTTTKIWGNGDINSHQQALDYCQKYGVNGVLIGRAVFGNPWVFGNNIPNFADKFNVMVRHAYHFNNVFPHRTMDSLRKHFLLYTSGHPQAKQLRSQIIHFNTIKDLYTLEDEFLNC